MHIILNSDVLHPTLPPWMGLSDHVERFCREAAAMGAILVIPRTTLLENERQWAKLRSDELREIDRAVGKLRSWGVEIPTFDASTVVPFVDFVEQLQKTGVRVLVEGASLDEYREAERRACLHLPPQAADKRDDEMRDIIIWLIALRLAKQQGSAILVSRDNVHSGERGRREADEVGLKRADDFDKALDMMGLESPSAKLARSILEILWNELRGAGLPLTDVLSIKRVRDAKFLSDSAGRIGGSFRFGATTRDGRFSALVDARQATATQIAVKLTDITINDSTWRSGSVELESHGELPLYAAPSVDRLEELRRVIGEQE